MEKEDETIKEAIEQKMRKMHLGGRSKVELDSYLHGVLSYMQAAGIEPPVIWTMNYMCDRVDRLYMTDEEWNAVFAEY